MILFERFIYNTALCYYPKGLQEADEDYFFTKQNQERIKLQQEVWKLNKDLLEKFANGISSFSVEKKITINNAIHSSPSYVVEILREDNDSFFKMSSIYISFLIPFYHIVELKSSRKDYKISNTYKIDKEFDDTVKLKMKEIFNFYKFPETYLGYKFPELIVNREFNALNAFFTDYYRINHLF